MQLCNCAYIIIGASLIENIHLTIIQMMNRAKKQHIHPHNSREYIIKEIFVSSEQKYKHLLNIHDIRERIKLRTIVVKLNCAVDNGQ